MKYTEHEKLEKISEQSQFIGEFLEYLNEKEMCIAEYRSGNNYLLPVNKSVNTLLAEFLGIYLVKLEQEKREMLKSYKTPV